MLLTRWLLRLGKPSSGRTVAQRSFVSVLVAALVVALVGVPLVAEAAPGDRVASVGLTKGWATFGQVVPQGVATSGLQVGGMQTQTDVSNRWPDGSIRFAVVTVNVESSGVYLVTADSASSGSFHPTMPNARVDLNIGGTVYTAAVPSSGSSDTWLDGPLVQECRFTVVPTAGGNEHPTLEVIFDVRAYNGGGHRLDVTVENILQDSSAGMEHYSVAILGNGTTLYSNDSVAHGYLCRWRKAFMMGATQSNLTPDFEPAVEAGALPRYMAWLITSSSPSSDFDILEAGVLTSYMGAPGGRSEIAPYPDWTARFISHRTEAQKRLVLKQGDLAGAWPVHLRDTDGTLITLDERPDFWFDGRGPSGNKPLGALSETGPLIPDNAHQPSLAYVPYLTTGDRYYADEMAFWANYVLQMTWFAVRNGAEGLLYRDATGQGNQVRGIAWGLRNMVDCAAYLPDASPYKSYFIQKVQNNLDHFDDYASNYDSPLGTVLEAGVFNSSNLLFTTLWQNDYVGWAIDHAQDQGFEGGSVLRNKIAAFVLKLFTSFPEYPREYGAPMKNSVAVGTATSRSPSTWNYWGTIGEVWTKSVSGSRNSSQTNFDYHGKSSRLMLMVAVEQNMLRAQEAYDYLNPFLTERGNPPQLARLAGWAIAFSDDVEFDNVRPAAPTNVRRIR